MAINYIFADEFSLSYLRQLLVAAHLRTSADNDAEASRTECDKFTFFRKICAF